ncbi:hypothetical protein RHG10_10870 [Clostridioides difficile]|nr:hypothetical protein [Clostridioides difficile]
MWYVNTCIEDVLIESLKGFILTMWYVNMEGGYYQAMDGKYVNEVNNLAIG